MVLKLDHVSFSCGIGDAYEERIPRGYQKKFAEYDLPNIACKADFLELKSPWHNIFMYDGGEESIPVEVTQYPQVIQAISDITVNGRTILWPVVDREAAVELFTALGGKGQEDLSEVVFKPFLDKEPFTIRFVVSENISKSVLDMNGYTSIGLFVDNVFREIKKLADKNYMVTEMNSLTVAGKKMDIGFVRGKNGEIVELISLSKS